MVITDAAHAEAKPDQVATELRYLKPDPKYDTVRPHTIIGKVSEGQERSNIEYVLCKTTISNVRGEASKGFSLQRNGFEWAQHEIDCSIATDDDIVKYMSIMEVFLKEYFNASRVFIYDFVVCFILKRTSLHLVSAFFGISAWLMQLILSIEAAFSSERRTSTAGSWARAHASEQKLPYWQVKLFAMMEFANFSQMLVLLQKQVA
jgi:hypothetical protein